MFNLDLCDLLKDDSAPLTSVAIKFIVPMCSKLCAILGDPLKQCIHNYNFLPSSKWIPACIPSYLPRSP